MQSNRIQNWRDAGGIEWRRPISRFAGRYGVTTCPWLAIPVILVEDAGNLVPGLLRPAGIPDA